MKDKNAVELGELGAAMQHSRYTSEDYSRWGKMKKGKKSSGSGRKKLVTI